MDRWTDGQMDRWTDGQMDRWTDGQMDRWTRRVKRWYDGGNGLAVGKVKVKCTGMMAYERLEAWRSAHLMALAVFSATDGWPTREMYGLTAQARRAALSVPTNIAEGVAKRGRHEFGRYLDIALGSLSELSYLLRFSRDRRLLTMEDWSALEARRDTTGRLVYGLYR